MQRLASAEVNEVAMPAASDLLLILIAVTAVSTSAPLIAATAVPALALAFWRNALGCAALLPVVLARHRGDLMRLGAHERRLTLAAGVLLACHFGTWITSLRYTTVASSTALVATQPVWAALFARWRGACFAASAWWGIGVAVAATAALTGIDVTVSTRAVIGDVLALIGAIFAAGYVTAGAAARRTVTTTTYATLCYATTAVVLLGAVLVAGQPLGGYRGIDWWRIIALTAGAQLLGHTTFNRVLRNVSATVVSLSILFEVPGAIALAAIFLHQHLRLVQLPAFAVLLLGLAVVIGGGGRAVPAE